VNPVHTFGPATRWAIVLVLALGAGASGIHAQTAAIDLDTVRAGPLDAGKMWAFEYAPAQHFSETYGFQADSAWFAHARSAAVRVPGCSAAFVSPYGLVATNHHCARRAITAVQAAGENFLDDGFFARSLAEERRIPDYYVDQLVAIEDVSDEIFRAQDGLADEAARDRARQATTSSIRDRLLTRHERPGVETRVQVVRLYHGGRYSAYVFHRYTDVRLVAAPELLVGFFGGDPDNFTYPRYALDYTFHRVFDEAGAPLRPSHHFTFSQTGAAEGEPVFVIGSPGRTNRLLTVAQLEFLRDVDVSGALAFLQSRLEPMRAFLALDPERAEEIDLRNRIFSVSNREKGTAGRLAALRDPVVMARRADAQRAFRAAIEAQPDVRQQWGGVMDELDALQSEKARLADAHIAFHRLGDGSAGSRTIRRAQIAGELEAARAAGAPADTVRALEARLGAVDDHPPELERGLLEARLRDFERALGRDHPVTVVALNGETPAQAASRIVQRSVLADSARLAAALAGGGGLPAHDAGVALARRLAPAFEAYRAEWARLTAREARLDEQLGRARFAVYGTDLPPDGTGSPRISDGVVAGYPYNGTLAPSHTTFHGMYDRYHSFGPGSEWDLPERWRTPPSGLDLGTGLNFVSNADTFSGSSGSPAVTRDLHIVGFNFDRNIEGLSRDYIYLPEPGRNVMVDVRAIRASLQHVYDMQRLVDELDRGTAPR
jgi:hypothetical protein